MKDKNVELQGLFNEYWEHRLKHNPTFATYIGDHRYDDALENISEESIAAQIDYFKNLLAKIETIDETLLTAGNKLNHTLFKNTLTNHIRMYHYKILYIPLNHMTGPHIDFPQIIEYHPFKTRQDIENYIARLHAFPRLIDQVIQNMKKGIQQKIVAFQKIMEYVLGQVETFTQFTPEDNPLFTPLLKMKNEFSNQDKEDIKKSVQEALASGVTPAYRKLYHYLSTEYMKHCREKEGIWSLPDGVDMYKFYTRYHTTTDLSPEEIHNIGKSEVEKISREMEKVMKKIGFNGSIREFAAYVSEKKDLYPKTGKEILDGYRDILSHMDKRLPDFFGRLPEAGYAIKEIEKYREQAAPAAYYYPPPRDFSRPGYFYANTYKPEQRPRFIMEALSYHEAVPGHHLQIALMQEQKDMPNFRRYEGATAFIEGWALYAEKLAKEMGLYPDDFSEYGRLTFALWRAARLVVDTGLHFYKWSRDESIQFCRETTGLEDHEIEVEIDRYIAIPGQALSYKIGELKILELREKAVNVRGSKFNIKDFHDRLLENGALPLYALETVMNEWMKS
ncbi:MAG: DUF885 domain-containing protein [Thermodesulfovibrionia bacterium]|nr:DUF885 domain-containing protein [Thermodesulfovibrionia bacterium]